jgi:hypothetical protein
MTALGINNPNSKWMQEYNGRNGGVNVARPAPSLESQIDFLTGEIAKRQHEGAHGLAERLIWKREMLRLALYVDVLDEQAPDFGGAMELSGLPTPTSETRGAWKYLLQGGKS